jgi:hypothetical protein
VEDREACDPAAIVLGAVAYGVHKLTQSSNPPV